MKKTLIVLFLLNVNIFFGQSLSKNLYLKLSEKTDVFQVVEEDKKRISLFFSDKVRARAIRLDENFTIIDSISSERPAKEFDDIAGYSISGDRYYSHWSSSDDKKIASQCFDFETMKTTITSHLTHVNNEKTINKITINNVFYLITITKNTSILNFYVFKNGKMEKKVVDFSNRNFVSYDNKRCNLWQIIAEITDFETALSFQNIQAETPPSLTLSANKKKAYTFNNQLFFTIDNNKGFTQSITVNLDDFTGVVKSYTQPYIDPTSVGITESNSFLYKNHLIQFKLNTEIMYLSVKDLEGNEIKSFTVHAGKEIHFKNTEIIQENGSVKNTRILDQSNQFLRKVTNLHPSVSCYNNNNTTHLTLGAVSLVQNDAVVYGALIGGITGALIGAAISSNYSVNNLNSYKGRKVVYINCLFDQEFNPIEGEVKRFSFDELRVFAVDKENLMCQTVFKMNSKLYFGGYNKATRVYSFYSFKD